MQYLQCRLVRVQIPACDQLFVESVKHRAEPPIGSENDPVGQRLPRQIQPFPRKLLLLSIQRHPLDVFLAHDKRHHGGRCEAAWKCRTWHPGFHHGGLDFIFLARPTAVDVLHMLHNDRLRWNVFEFAARLTAHLVHEMTATRAGPFFLGQTVFDTLHRQILQHAFPLAGLFLAPLIGDGFNRWFLCVRLCLCLWFVKQIQLQLVLVRTFTG